MPCEEGLSVVSKLEEKVKDLERKTANFFMDNASLTTKLKASQETEARQKEEVRDLEERLAQALKEQVLICAFTYATALVLLLQIN